VNIRRIPATGVCFVVGPGRIIITTSGEEGMEKIGQIYQWLWFRTEFWLTPTDRRPYTFLMRDLLFGKPVVSWICCALWFGGWIYWSTVEPVVMIVPILSAFVLGHVVWGEKWLFGQQEFPEYLGE